MLGVLQSRSEQCGGQEESVSSARYIRPSNSSLISATRRGFCLQSFEKVIRCKEKMRYVPHAVVSRNSHHTELVSACFVSGDIPNETCYSQQTRSDEFIYTGHQQALYDRLTKWVCYSFRGDVVTLSGWHIPLQLSLDISYYFIQDFRLNFRTLVFQ